MCAVSVFLLFGATFTQWIAEFSILSCVYLLVLCLLPLSSGSASPWHHRQDLACFLLWEVVAVAVRCSHSPLPGCCLGLCVAYLKSHPLSSCCNMDGTKSSVKTKKSVLSCFFALLQYSCSQYAGESSWRRQRNARVGSTVWAGRADLSICLAGAGVLQRLLTRLPSFKCVTRPVELL